MTEGRGRGKKKRKKKKRSRGSRDNDGTYVFLFSCTTRKKYRLSAPLTFLWLESCQVETGASKSQCR